MCGYWVDCLWYLYKLKRLFLRPQRKQWKQAKRYEFQNCVVYSSQTKKRQQCNCNSRHGSVFCSTWGAMSQNSNQYAVCFNQVHLVLKVHYKTTAKRPKYATLNFWTTKSGPRGVANEIRDTDLDCTANKPNHLSIWCHVTVKTTGCILFWTFSSQNTKFPRKKWRQMYTNFLSWLQLLATDPNKFFYTVWC